MYTCPKCKKFSSVGPGLCWRCNVKLEDQDVPKPTVLTLRLRPRPRVLFMGVIDGGPELNFIQHLRLPSCIAHFTSYGPAPQSLLRLHGRTYLSAEIVVEQNIDATQLLTHYPLQRFDAVVWIGPTNDETLSETPNLVQLFVTSAGRVLTPRGVVFVVQDIKTPNFRRILTLPGAYFCCEINLAGRTKTQHSEKINRMEGRADQLIAFTFADGEIVSINDAGNTDFVNVLNMIMSTAASRFNMPPQLKKYNTNFRTKHQLASLIFDFANNMEEPSTPPPLQITLAPEAKSSIYKCPRCRSFASSGPGQCWRCNVDLVGEP
jgi:hypothetical protein